MKETIKKIFADHFGVTTAPLIVRSPGRVNIIGEHTDYNAGFVLPAAIDKAAYLAISLRKDSEIHLWAEDLQEKFSTSVTELKPVKDPGWPNYMLGAAAQFLQKDIPLKGFNAVLMSDVPIGAGLSSSAAIECATVFALNELLDARLEKLEMIKMAQKAEHTYAGVQCGIMDQFASMMGRKDSAIKLDCRSLDFEYVPLKLDGIKILLLNTNVKHSLATSAYNTRRMECEQGVAWIREFEPDVTALRDATISMLDKYVLPKSEVVYRRSRFVVEEIARLQAGCANLAKGDIGLLGEKMFATHEGLSQQYEVSCRELDLLVDLVKDNAAVYGARMMGGGFGGCTINLVKEEAVDELLAAIRPVYEKTTGLRLTHYVAAIEAGTSIV